MKNIYILFTGSVNQKLFAIILVILIALCFRLIMVLQSNVINPLSADAGEYYLYAINLKHYGVYSLSKEILNDEYKINIPKPDSKRAPGYSLFLYPFIDIPPTKDMFDAILIVQAMISTLTVFVSFMLFQSFLGWKGAITSAMLTALCPHLIAANIYLLSETLFTLFLISFVATIAFFIKNTNYKYIFFAGILLGLTMLVKPTMNYFVLILLPVIILIYPKNIAGKYAVILFIGCLIVYGPWLVRNAVSVDESMKSHKALASLHKGMYPDVMYEGKKESYGVPNKFDPKWKERKNYQSVLMEIGRRFVDEPLVYLKWYLLGKPLMLMSWNAVVGMGDIYVYSVSTTPYFTSKIFALTHLIMYFIHWPLMLIAIGASIVVWFPSFNNRLSHNEQNIVKFCSLIIFYFIVIHTIGLPLPRYAIPIRPIMYGLSIFGLRWMYMLVKEKYKYKGAT